MKEKAAGKDKLSTRRTQLSEKPQAPDIVAQPVQAMLQAQQGTVDSRFLTSSDVLYLQRQVGNRATDRLVAEPRGRVRDRRDTAREFSSQAALAPLLVPGPVVQRTPNSHVGAVQEGSQLQDLEGGTGSTPGEWHKSGEGGYSRLMQGAAGEMVEGMAEEGDLEGLMLHHVAPDRSGLPAQQKEWSQRAADAKEEIDSWTFGFAPGNIRELWQQRYDSASKQVEVIEKCGTELEQKTNQFNSFVPQGNGFYTSVARLSSMQALLGATDNASLAAALVQGLRDAQDVIERYRDKYEDGNRRLTTEKLDFPEGDESVTQAAREMTDVSRDLDAAYMGFQTTVLSGKIGTIKKEYADDEARLKEINEVKQFVRNVGKTVDFTMSAVRAAPTMVTNVTKSARKARASVNAVRNRRDIIAGRRPRFNPTYVTTDENGNMIVRNMQTGLDRNVVTGEKLPSPVDEGITLPTSVSEGLGKITDFIYHEEVKQINLRLEQMKIRVNAVSSVIDSTLFEQKLLTYQNALNKFASKAAALQARVEDRRKEYREFGTQLDRFAQVDRETRSAGQGLARGAERYATVMTVVAGIQETLALGTQSQAAAPSGLLVWWRTVRRRRFNRPTQGEVQTVAQIHRQLTKFRTNVNLVKENFGDVARQANSLMGQY